MNLGKICNRAVVTISADDSVLAAATKMREHHVGDVIVVGDEAVGAVPTGILTDRDIVIGLVAKGISDVEQLLVSDVLTRELVTAREDEGLDTGVRRMREHSVRRLPIVDDEGELVGVCTLDDVLRVLSRQLGELADVTRQQRKVERATRSA